MTLSPLGAVTTAQPGRSPGALGEACREFEAWFIAELLKPLDQVLASQAHPGQDVMAQLARRELAGQLAGSFGLGELLYQQLTRHGTGSNPPRDSISYP